MSVATHCHGCGTELPLVGRAVHRRKWCSDRCRRHALYSGSCADCGRPTYNGTSPPPERCSPCNRVAAKIWTREAIIAAIQAWARESGAPPAATDWNPHHAVTLGHPEKAERFYGGGAWPNVSTVQDAFGSWNAAIAAAGLLPRRTGNYGRDGEDMALCQEIRERYEAGESGEALAPRYGCSSNAIRWRIRKAGGRLRSQREAQALRARVAA